MIKSTFISIVLHISIILFAFYGMPSLKIKEPIDEPIDIVDESSISTQTSLKLGSKEDNEKINKKKLDLKKEKNKQPPPPIKSTENAKKKNVELIKKKELLKKKEIKEIAELIRKKPKFKVERKKNIPKVVSKPSNIKKSITPKVIPKPKHIKVKQKQNLAKGILNTLAEAKLNNEEKKIDKTKKENLLTNIKKIAGNSNRQVKEKEIKLSVTDINIIQNHITKFWKLSYAASEVKIIIPLKIKTNRDGSVDSVNIYDKSEYIKNKFYRATADAARRAVIDSSPLPLPKGKEKKFENFILDFDTSFINSY